MTMLFGCVEISLELGGIILAAVVGLSAWLHRKQAARHHREHMKRGGIG